MQINGNELSQYLKKDLSPIYIISSNELFWQQFYAKQILNTAFSKGFPQDSVIRFTGDMFKSKDDLSKLAESCTSIGLFADKVIVTIDLEKSNNSAFKAIHQEVLSVVNECLNDSLLVIITIPRLSKNEISSCKPLSSLVNKGIFAIFYELNESQLTKHVITMASSYDITLDNLEASFLVSSYEGNLTSLDQILQKLQLCGISGKINLDEFSLNIGVSS
jgi:DNA polymerase III delta subunit